MRFGILGPLEVHDGVKPLQLSGEKQRALLAILLLRANQVVSSEQLIDDLWGETPPSSGAKALQVRVSQLRKALGGDVAPDAGSRVSPARRARRARPLPLRAARGGRDGRRADASPQPRSPKRSRCGGGRRSRTSPTSRSPRRRSGGWRSCGCATLREADRGRSGARPTCGPGRRGRGARRRPPVARAAASAADARRCTARVVRRRHSRPIRRPAARSSTSWGSSQARRSRSWSGRSCATIQRCPWHRPPRRSGRSSWPSL